MHVYPRCLALCPTKVHVSWVPRDWYYGCTKEHKVVEKVRPRDHNRLQVHPSTSNIRQAEDLERQRSSGEGAAVTIPTEAAVSVAVQTQRPTINDAPLRIRFRISVRRVGRVRQS